MEVPMRHFTLDRHGRRGSCQLDITGRPSHIQFTIDSTLSTCLNKAAFDGEQISNLVRRMFRLGITAEDYHIFTSIDQIPSFWGKLDELAGYAMLTQHRRVDGTLRGLLDAKLGASIDQPLMTRIWAQRVFAVPTAPVVYRWLLHRGLYSHLCQGIEQASLDE